MIVFLIWMIVLCWDYWYIKLVAACSSDNVLLTSVLESFLRHNLVKASRHVLSKIVWNRQGFGCLLSITSIIRFPCFSTPLSLLQTRREKCGRMLCWDFQDACWFQIPLDWTCQSIIGRFMPVLKIVLLPFQCENTTSEATTFVTMMMSLGRRFSGFHSKISVV